MIMHFLGSHERSENFGHSVIAEEAAKDRFNRKIEVNRQQVMRNLQSEFLQTNACWILKGNQHTIHMF